MHALRRSLRDRLRPIWRAYLRVPRPIRWPVTGIVLVLAAVIVANLVFSVDRTIERTYLIPPGELRVLEVQVEPGRNSEIRWQIGERAGDAADFPLRATLRGPDEAQESLAGPSAFRFKGGFTLALYTLELRNEADNANAAVEVRWTVR